MAWFKNLRTFLDNDVGGWYDSERVEQQEKQLAAVEEGDEKSVAEVGSAFGDRGQKRGPKQQQQQRNQRHVLPEF